VEGSLGLCPRGRLDDVAYAERAQSRPASCSPRRWDVPLACACELNELGAAPAYASASSFSLTASAAAADSRVRAYFVMNSSVWIRASASGRWVCGDFMR
jgi:hypothetical protein